MPVEKQLTPPEEITSERVERDPGGLHRAAYEAYVERWTPVREAAKAAARAGEPETACPYQRTGRVGDFHARLEWLAAYDLEREAMARKASE